MSMCFLKNHILYADCFQIRDYTNCTPGMTDNKISISESKRVIIAVMGKVPADDKQVLERLERAFDVYLEEIKAKKDKESSTLTFDQSIMAIDIDMLMVFKTSAKKGFVKVTASSPGNNPKRVVVDNAFDDEVLMFSPTHTFAMMEAGMTPAQVFKGVSQYKGTVSREFTAYDLKKKKFI